MSIKLKLSGYDIIRNKSTLPKLYKLYVKMPNRTMNNRMNKRGQLSNLTRLAFQELGYRNNTYIPPLLINLPPTKKINTIKKAINKITAKNRIKAATTIQHYFKTKRERNAFANTNRGKSITNKVPTIMNLISSLRRKQRRS